MRQLARTQVENILPVKFELAIIVIAGMLGAQEMAGCSMIHMFRRCGKWLEQMLCLQLRLLYFLFGQLCLPNSPFHSKSFLSSFLPSMSLRVLAQAVLVCSGVLGRWGRWVGRWVGSNVMVTLIAVREATGIPRQFG